MARSSLLKNMQGSVITIVVPLLLLVAATVVISFLDLDRTISRYCYRDNQWIGRTLAVGTWIYHYGEIPGIILGVGGAVAATVGLFWKPASSCVKPGYFLALTLAIGPGLLVNAILKPHWSRPRPIHVEEFGGEAQFVGAWNDVDNSKYKSFPSGHASIAFYLIAPAFIWFRRSTRWASLWFTVGGCYGAVVGFARIAQGSHFLSDVLWAGGLVYLSCMIVGYLFGFVGTATGGAEQSNDEPQILSLDEYRESIQTPQTDKAAA